MLIDCGEDWLGRLEALGPDALALTHAHPDHAGGLRAGAPCPVYATRETWSRLPYPVARRRVVPLRRPTRIAGIRFEAWPVQHSLLAPAVAYRITAGGLTICYAPDVAFIPDRRRVLRRVRLYVGDGASVTRPLVRRRGRGLIGHAPIGAQLDWCREAGVPRAIFTHCGTDILSGDGRRIRAAIRAIGRERGVEARIAYDGLVIPVSGPSSRPPAIRV